ncbi:hypothetical protein [Massilia sp. Root335]|jgi:hypothetical protein|uniref:hypothetical protein n=1 Tax=Massilia sp. Root335 TaxID=1736517 RepID=UPI0006F44E3B|nr:hypothetical protein [Massilia sp. Root335]KQV45033.1 hypothetical protein ASC93_00275 [Massilia sp. Root335]
METNRITAVPAGQAGEVTTFYSYDSAPVRSLALAHAAWLLAGRAHAKTPVLMIDWDLEAPGLHHYFPCADEGQGGGGLLELFEACGEQLHGNTSSDDADALAGRVLDTLDWDDYIVRVDDSRPLYLMRAGRFDDSYGERVDRLDWDALFCACPALFRTFAAHVARRFAHVLIDCRSGRSAAASVCTALLPDKIVGLFTPDARSLDGLQGVVARALDYRCSHEDEQRPLLVYPLPCPVDGAADARLRWRFGDAQRGQPGYQARLERMLAECYGLSSVALDSYLDEVQLPQAAIVGMPPAGGRIHAGERDRCGPQRAVDTLLEWLAPGHFPWRPLPEVRLVQAVEALGERAADPQAPALVRELARLAQLYLGQQSELEAARRIEQHVVALEQGLHAMEEGKRGHAASRRPGEPPPDALDDKLSRLQELIDARSPHEARALADSLRSTILRPSVAHPLRRRGAAMIKQVYLQEGDKDALLAFTLDEVSSLEGALIQAAGGRPLVAG